MITIPKYKIGDKVIYIKNKYSAHPNMENAKDVNPTQFGEFYQYKIKKYWRVIGVNNQESKVFVETRTKKVIQLEALDINLRHPTLFERIFSCHKWYTKENN